MNNTLANLATLSTAKSKRLSSYDRTGGNSDRVGVEPGATHTLAAIEGAGQITHLWITIDCADPLYRRNLIFRCYWDGEENPSVESPIGDFFGNGWGMHYNFSTPPLACAPAGGKAHVCYFPMPFGRGARIEIENQSVEPIRSLYYYVDYEEWESCPDSLGRFHAWYNQELTAPESEQGNVENEWGLFGDAPKNASDANNYLFAEIEGTGHFVGVNYYVNCPSPMWYGEGDDMFLVDGEPWPGSAHGTGTEDYFNMAWCPREPFSHPSFGFGRVPGENGGDKLGWLGRTHCYRLHLTDPVRFTKSLRASIEHGHANVLTLELATVAYWYQSEPHKPFPALPSVEARKPRPEITAVDIHRWRDAWRKSVGGANPWGDERPSGV
ncbi:glycoside hydrolase family 172 protein [Armatimonas rosea]|uniref:DUF2961 domain-containing protein n=1 Tax=Armatimonas rosea TaxID=685828 RepID=A0A7W9W5A3_ARMRO|nr:glycoside hydrolase family 172 protein [Armatimonas rosea]MBB6048362.1 hypothetical protein [Armatimonas rosea]